MTTRCCCCRCSILVVYTLIVCAHWWCSIFVCRLLGYVCTYVRRTDAITVAPCNCRYMHEHFDRSKFYVFWLSLNVRLFWLTCSTTLYIVCCRKWPHIRVILAPTRANWAVARSSIQHTHIHRHIRSHRNDVVRFEILSMSMKKKKNANRDKWRWK